MQYLSYQQIETIAEAVLKDFLGDDIYAFRSIDVEKFAQNYLGLDLRYMKLSDDGSVLGLTTYGEIILELERDNRKDKIIVPKDTVIIENSLLYRKNIGRKNFTISHECAHQVLFRAAPESHCTDYRKQFTIKKTYSLRELATQDDWCEWQANVLGAAILMPVKLIEECLFKFSGYDPIKLYGDRITRRSDRMCIYNIASFLGVSESALIIRLKQLKLIDVLPLSKYRDPREVVI